jgi:hypothetical protein
MSEPENDKKVKELIDAGTRADIERWFGLPSFEQLADQGVPPPPAPLDDPEIVEARKRRDLAIAAVDPAMFEAYCRRTDRLLDVVRFKPSLEVHIDPTIALLDVAMIDRLHTIAEPREVERSIELQDDLHDCTPQALLRDLHRPELFFDKVFEIVDVSEEQRLDVVAAVAEAMRTSWTLPPFGLTPLQQARALIRDSREQRRQPWADIKTGRRRVTE